jgi:hypothetical protein
MFEAVQEDPVLFGDDVQLRRLEQYHEGTIGPGLTSTSQREENSLTLES